MARERNKDGTFRPQPLDERFWERVRGGEGCWEWIGSRNDLGYGLIGANGRTRKAYRVSFELAYGPIPAGKHVCHHCDNPACVRPDHLFLGSHTDNMRDRQQKGRTKNLDLGPEAYRKRTHCPQGHPYEGTNVRFRADGRRYCGECWRLRTAKYTRDNRETINARKRAKRRRS